MSYLNTIRVVHSVGPDHGIAEVYNGGILIGQVDGYCADRGTYVKGFLGNIGLPVTFRLSGKKNPGSSGFKFRRLEQFNEAVHYD